MCYLQLVVMIGVRKALELFFTRRELKILDDVLPEMTRRVKEEERMQKEAEDTDDVRLSYLNSPSSYRLC